MSFCRNLSTPTERAPIAFPAGIIVSATAAMVSCVCRLKEVRCAATSVRFHASAHDGNATRAPDAAIIVLIVSRLFIKGERLRIDEINISRGRQI